jgi:TPR repeat protein
MQWLLADELLSRTETQAEGLRWLERAGAAGSPQAQRELGRRLLASSNRSPDDERRAARLLQQAAESNDVQAAYELARLYRDGVGVERSTEQYVSWLRRAASNVVPAMSLLGESYRDGDGVQQNYVESLRWFSTAARWNDGTGLRDLGDAWRHGNGVMSNRVLSWVAYYLAERAGVPSAPESLRDIERVMDAKELERARLLAEAWRVGNPFPADRATP